MKKPPNPQMAELGPFYQICWLGLLSCTFNLLATFWFVSWSMSTGWGWPFAAAFIGASLVTFLGVFRVFHGRQRRRLREQLARAITPSRPRLQRQLQELEGKLREFSGDASARLVLIPESAVVLSTLRSNREPVVEVTAGFLNTYASHPRLMEAALAHEAGHIAARDVERFRRMLSLMWTLLALLALLFLALAGTSDVGARLIGQLLYLTLAMGLAWSALVVAREVQSDAFAVKVLGKRPMRFLLEGQLELRAAQARQRTALQRLRTWLLQPDLRWRSTLPFLDGHLGARVEVKLGLAMAAFVGTLAWNLAIVKMMLARTSWATSLENIKVKLSTSDASLTGFSLVFSGIFMATLAWVAWTAYSFFWVRSRALGRGDSSTRSSGLRSLLFFCLPGMALLLLYLVWMLLADTRGLWLVLLMPAFVLPLALLLWAAGKLALVSPRERQRERPSLPLAVLSLLIILALTGGFFSVVAIGNAVVSVFGPSLNLAMLMVMSVLILVVTSLGAGLLAHHLAGARLAGGSIAGVDARHSDA